MRFTPEDITILGKNDIYVFGSNTKGKHKKGAALIALENFGAKLGQARGLQGNSYAIVTKDLEIGERSISLSSIKREILEMYSFATLSYDLTFYVVKIGCSLAGYTIKEMSDLFISCETVRPSNVILPKEFYAKEK